MKRYIYKYKNLISYLFVLTSFILMFFIVCYVKFHQENSIELFNKMIKKEAISYYNIIVLNRQWVASHGGIYVKQKEGLDPNPYLKDNFLYSKDNQKLIKVNPAWMTRQVSELSLKNKNEIFFTMVSSKPKNPNNLAKSEFDVTALEYLQKNKNKKFYSKISYENEKFNLMGSLHVTKSCLKCHTTQNYRVGDVVGGLKVVIPANEIILNSKEIKDDSNYLVLLIIFITVVVSSIFIWLVNKFYKHQEQIEQNLSDIKKLENSNELLLVRYKYALDGSKYGIWDWDLIKNEVFFDENWKRVIGYKDNELESDLNEWKKRVHPDDFEKAEADIESNQKGETSYYENIHRVKHKNGSWVWILDRGKTYFDESGVATRMVGFHADITKLKKLEVELSESKKNLLLAQKISNMGYWKWNKKTKELFVSDTLYEILEIRNSDLKTYDDFKEFIHEDDLNRVLAEHDNILETKKKAIYYYHLITSSGKELVVEEHLDLIKNDINHEISILGTIHDMSNRMEMERKLKEKDELMLHQSKSAAMGEMISMIAHQWRQPITAISMSANNILANIELEMLEPAETKQIANNIAKQTQYLSKTIDDFRNFFMKDKETALTTVGELFDETCTIILASLKNNDIELKLDFDRTIQLKTYTRELLQVLLNIIKNAKEAFEETDIENRYIKVSVKNLENHIKIKIEDNAGGIPSDKLDRIFEAYFTTKQEHNGTGLGLYMSQTIVRKHLGGKIKVYNSDVGAVFEVRLQKSI